MNNMTVPQAFEQVQEMLGSIRIFVVIIGGKANTDGAQCITKDFNQAITRLGEGGTTGALIDLKVQIYEWYIQITRTGVWASQLHGVKR